MYILANTVHNYEILEIIKAKDSTASNIFG